MKKLIILLLLLAGTTSVYAASTFQWSRLSHTRLNNFVRLTKLPVGQYLIGVYSSGNTIQEYSPTEPVVITNTKEVIKEVPIEKEVIQYIVVEKQIADPRVTTGSYILLEKDMNYLKQCRKGVYEDQAKDCIYNYLTYTIRALPLNY